MRQFVHSPEQFGSGGRRRRVAVTALLVGLAVLTAGAPLRAQGGSVGGTIYDQASGRPLSGAQVAVVGAQRGVLTDANGHFRLAGLTGASVQLRVVMLGFKEVLRPTRVGDLAVRIPMEEAAVTLNELIVTGTAGGTQKRALGNSVGQIKAADVVAQAPISDVQELINGRAPGVVVQPGTGMIGSGSRIRIRGYNTFSLSPDPLIYVDGIRVDNEAGSGYSMQAFGSSVISRLNDFDPEQIQSIEILKGPAAATLYGTEAARGVINIITKKGAPGGTRYSFQVKQGANWFMNPEGRFYTNYWRNPTTGTVEGLNSYTHGKQLGYNMLRTGQLQGYNASVSGGNEGVRYYVSADLNRDQGAEPDNFRNQFSGRANVELQPTQGLNISVSSGYIQSRTGLSCEAGCGGLMWTTTFGTPANLPANRCALYNNAYGCGFYQGFRSGPPKVDRWMNDWQGVNRFTGSVTANWKPMKWMSHRIVAGTDLTNEQNVEMFPYVTDDTVAFFWGPDNSNGYKDKWVRTLTYNTLDYSGTANFDVRPNLSSATSVGLQYYQRHVESVEAFGVGYPAPGLQAVSATATQPYAGDSFSDNNTLGFFLQELVGFNERLFLTGAVRVDNNSSFGSDLKWVYYPKASLSWVLTEEPFFKDRAPRWVNTFKLRAAYGENGQPPAAFTALRTFQSATGPNDVPAVSPYQVGNAKLGPERGKEIELGFESAFLNDRLGLDFTYYHTKTVDAILSRQVAPSTGFAGSSQYVNAGAILSQGVEALLKGQLLNRKNLGWDMTFSLATNKGKVLQLSGTDTMIISGDIAWKVGGQPRGFYLPKIVSATYDATTKTATNIMCDDGKGGSMPCYSGNTVQAPRVYLGKSVPGVEGSIGTTLRLFNNVRLGGLIDFKTDYMKGNGNDYVRCYLYATCYDRIYGEQTDPKRYAGMTSNNRLRDYIVQDASFAKLREISLTYTLPDNYVRAFGGHGATINVAARNLHTWTGWKGLDPESQYLSNANYEQDALPMLASFVTTINVNF